MDWQLPDTKNQLSDMMTRALEEGPQRICWRGQVLVMMAEAEFRRLTSGQSALRDCLLNGPDLSDLDLARDPSPMRDVRL